MTTQVAQTTQTYTIFIKATPEAIWDAITQPDLTQKYFYGARVKNTPERYHAIGPDGSVWGDAPMFEFDPPRRMVQGWNALFDPNLANEAESRVSWQIEPQAGYCMLTIVHDHLEGAPKTATEVATGWMFILSGLKTVLETAQPLANA